MPPRWSGAHQAHPIPSHSNGLPSIHGFPRYVASAEAKFPHETIADCSAGYRAQPSCCFRVLHLPNLQDLYSTTITCVLWVWYYAGDSSAC